MTDDERLPEPSEDPEGTVEALLAEVLGLIERAVAAEFPDDELDRRLAQLAAPGNGVTAAAEPRAELDRAAAIGYLARAEAATMRREAERYLDAALDRAAEIVATAREQAEHVLTAAREAATVLATAPQIDDLFEAAAWVFERPVDHRGAGPDRSPAAVGARTGGVRDDRYAAAVGDHDDTRSRLVGRYTPLVRSFLTQGGLSRAAAEALEPSVWSQLMHLLPQFPGHRISGWTVISTCKDVLLLCRPEPAPPTAVTAEPAAGDHEPRHAADHMGISGTERESRREAVLHALRVAQQSGIPPRAVGQARARRALGR
jgi:hypothetical protein